MGRGRVPIEFRFFLFENTPEDDLQESNRPLHREFASYDYSLIPKGEWMCASLFLLLTLRLFE